MGWGYPNPKPNTALSDLGGKLSMFNVLNSHNIHDRAQFST